MPVLASAEPQTWRQAQRRWLMFQSAVAIAVLAAAAGFFLVLGEYTAAQASRCSQRFAWRRRADPADDSRGVALAVGQRSAARPLHELVLGRQPPAAAEGAALA